MAIECQCRVGMIVALRGLLAIGFSVRGRNKEKLVDRSLILNHEVIFPRAAVGFGGVVSPPNRVLTVMSIRN